MVKEKWTYELCKETALKYEYKKDFIKENKNIYNAIRKKKWKELTNHLKKTTTRIFKNIDADYNVDHFQFLNIIKPEVSYILGLLWADGNIYKDYRVTLECKYSDEIDSDYNIYKTILELTGKWGIHIRKRYDKRTKKVYNSCVFMTSNKFLVNFLKENDYDKKSYTSPNKILSKIPEYLKNHFYRGYSDGDGCYYKKEHTVQFSIASTINQNWSFMFDLCDKLKLNTFKDSKEISLKGKHSRFRIVNKSDIVKLGEYFYHNSDNLRLERKYDKYIEIKNTNIEKATPKWTEEEILFLKNNYYINGCQYCVEKLNRNIDAIYTRIKLLKKSNNI